MTTHELKTWPSVFDAVLDGSKTFEWRKDDRGFEIGDVLRLREWDPDSAKAVNNDALGYTGREVTRVVTYVLRGRFGVPDGYVVLGMRDERAHAALVEAPSFTAWSTLRDLVNGDDASAFDRSVAKAWLDSIGGRS